MNKIIRLAALILALCMLLPSAASAEALLRGSSGEAVRELQQMLLDAGFLSDKPDGKFGRNTEAAVKRFQEAAGLEATGIADELTAEQLKAALELPAETGYPPFCNAWLSGGASAVCDFCKTHAQMYSDALNMLSGGDADSVLYAYMTCRSEVLRLYDEWLLRLPEHAQEPVQTARELAQTAMEAQHTALYDSCLALNEEMTPPDIEYGMLQWMRQHTAWLCQLLHTLDADG